MTDVILRISGMDCGACAVRIVRALQGLPGLREVSVSDTAGCACLTYDEMAVDLGEICNSSVARTTDEAAPVIRAVFKTSGSGRRFSTAIRVAGN